MSRRSSPEGFSRLFRIDGSWWDTLVAGIAELIGSAILVFIGCMGCVGSLIGPPPHLQVALTFGFAVASIVHIIGHFSHFHISPAVSISTLILGLTSLTTTGINILAQTLGAIIGYGMLRVVTPAEFLHAGNASAVDSFCVTVVHENISPIQGMLIEAVATGILILFVGACTDPRNRKNPDARAVKFALIISMLAFATGPYTGCSMNPARSFAPALWNNNWKHQWVYWLGPIVGSLVSSFLYKMLFWPKQQPREDVPEGTALNSINTDEPMIHLAIVAVIFSRFSKVPCMMVKVSDWPAYIQRRRLYTPLAHLIVGHIFAMFQGIAIIAKT